MKSKAKRNNNRPASFREKCRSAFAGAIKGLANINAAEKENVAASFDLDKRSVERRIDAMEKNRAVAKSFLVFTSDNGSRLLRFARLVLTRMSPIVMSLAQETRDFSRGRNAPLAPFRDIICRCFQQHLKHGLAGASPRL